MTSDNIHAIAAIDNAKRLGINIPHVRLGSKPYEKWMDHVQDAARFDKLSASAPRAYIAHLYRYKRDNAIADANLLAIKSQPKLR